MHYQQDQLWYQVSARLYMLALQDILKHKVAAKRELQEALGLVVGQEYMVLAFLGETNMMRQLNKVAHE
jgi:hypothetical protein